MLGGSSKAFLQSSGGALEPRRRTPSAKTGPKDLGPTWGPCVEAQGGEVRGRVGREGGV